MFYFILQVRQVQFQSWFQAPEKKLDQHIFGTNGASQSSRPRNSRGGGWLCHITLRSAVTHRHRGFGVSHACDTLGHVVCRCRFVLVKSVV